MCCRAPRRSAQFKVKPRLLLPAVAGDAGEIAPARTVPPHFARAFRASDADVATVFGSEDGSHFWVGSPLDMETRVCLDMETFVQRSNGVFGKSGTGKSFLTRLLLAGILQKTNAVSLIFDMHNDHGWEGRDPERGRTPKGLKQLFPSRVAIFTLDPASSRSRRVPLDGEVRIPYRDVEPEDIELLASTLRITPLGVQAAYRLPRFWARTGCRGSCRWRRMIGGTRTGRRRRRRAVRTAARRRRSSA